MAKLRRVRTLTMACCLWTEIPSTIKWITAHRDSAKHIDQLLRASINATIIQLAACFLDGFLVECLKWIAQKQSAQTFSQRVAAEFCARVQRSSGFEEISSLFKVAHGKSLAESVKKPELHETVRILFKFRNGLAHGRSIEYDTFANHQTLSFDHEFSGSYKDVEDYLVKKHFVKKAFTDGGSGWHYFTDAVADHFINVISVYPKAVLQGLPRKVAAPVRNLLEFSSKPRRWCL
jgi:hypothetical protein